MVWCVQVKLLLAQHKVTRECGLTSIVPKLWVEPVGDECDECDKQ